MNALLVCAAPYRGGAAEIAALGAAHDLVVGVDGGAALCMTAGIRPDLVVGDLDSLGPDDADALASDGVEFVRFDPHKDETDLELALEVVESRGATAVTVVAALAGRLDHSLATAGLLGRFSRLRPHIHEPDLHGWVLSGDGEGTLELAGTGSTFSVLPVADGCRLKVSGARWSSEDLRLGVLDSRGVSNVIEGHRASITVLEGTVLVLSPRDSAGRIGRTHT